MNHKLIEKYVDGLLTAEEKLEFANKLHQDQSFRHEVELYKRLVSVIKWSGRREEVKKTHEAFIKEYRKPAAPFNWKSLAAAVTIFLLSSVLIVTNFPTSQGIYEHTYMPYKVRIVRSEASGSLLAAYYAENNFDMVLRAYETMPAPTAKDHLIAGNAYLQTDKTSEALKSLKHVKQAGSGELIQIAQWYEAMAYLSLEEPEQAYALLSDIKSEPTHLFHHRVSNWLMFKVKMSEIF